MIHSWMSPEMNEKPGQIIISLQNGAQKATWKVMNTLAAMKKFQETPASEKKGGGGRK